MNVGLTPRDGAQRYRRCSPASVVAGRACSTSLRLLLASRRAVTEAEMNVRSDSDKSQPSARSSDSAICPVVRPARFSIDMLSGSVVSLVRSPRTVHSRYATAYARRPIDSIYSPSGNTGLMIEQTGLRPEPRPSLGDGWEGHRVVISSPRSTQGCPTPALTTQGRAATRWLRQPCPASTGAGHRRPPDARR